MSRRHDAFHGGNRLRARVVVFQRVQHGVERLRAGGAVVADADERGWLECRVLAFLDLGNVYGEDQSFDLSRYRMTAGAELRIFVPMFGAPLRFIYSSNLEPLPDDRFESFQFSIGATF